jgi:hypothetical protein
MWKVRNLYWLNALNLTKIQSISNVNPFNIIGDNIMKKQYVAFVRDHSISMNHLATDAAKDYNANLKAMQDAARDTGLDTILNVVQCGVGPSALVVREVVNSNVWVVEPMNENKYFCSGHRTPLFASVNDAVNLMRNVPDAHNSDVAFLVMVITDGEENASPYGAKEEMIANIKAEQATGRWTFVFRVPKGYKQALVRMGVPEGNIMEWDQTQQGIETSTHVTTSAIGSYFRGVSKGVTSTGKFYADLSGVSQRTVKAKLTDISYLVSMAKVETWSPLVIKDYSEAMFGGFIQGTVYYELTKPEKIQANKKIVIKDKKNGHMYAGAEARQLLNLPDYEVKVTPGNLGDYVVFIQSTSLNRKLVPGTYVLKYIS